MVCILLALAAKAGAVPADSSSPRQPAARAVAVPTIVKETVVRPVDGRDAVVFVIIGVAGAITMLGAGYLGARIATRTPHARHTNVYNS